MKSKRLEFIVLIALLGIVGCASTPKKGSAEAGQKMLQDDQIAIDKANTNYRTILLKNGESSHEAVAAKTEMDNLKNKMAADQIHVSQLQGIDGASSTTPAGPGTTKETTTTTTITTTPQH